MLNGYALAYDWLYNQLSANDRLVIQNALIQRARESYEAASSSYYIESLGNWWRSAYSQNHWSVNISALGIAALVLENESAEAAIWLNYSIDEIKKTVITFPALKKAHGMRDEDIRHINLLQACLFTII